MVARGVCEFHVPERRPANACTAASSTSKLAQVVRSALALAALLCAPLPAGADDLLVGAAVSLREPLTAIAREFEARSAGVRVQLSFGASSTLAAQARAGAPLDIFVAADPTLIDRLEQEDWSEARRDIARNSLVLVAASNFSLERPEDLLSPELRRLALPARAVPVGGYAREWLAHKKLLEPLKGRIVLTAHARATLAAVDAGHADAAIVYVTDVRQRRRARNELPIPEGEQPTILYTAALRSGASDLAREFFDALGKAGARKHLASAGFGPL